MKKKNNGHNLKCSYLNTDRIREKKVPDLRMNGKDSKIIRTYFCDALNIFTDYCPNRCKYFQK